MATTLEQLKQLQKQVRQLQIEQAKTRRLLRERGIAGEHQRIATRKPKLASMRIANNEGQRAIAILQRAGRLVELDPELARRAAEWRALSVEQQHQVTELLASVRMEPLLSKLIHNERR
jgi:hypothetical protein